MTKVVCLDRDGTVIVDQHYLKDPEKVVFETNVISALKLLHDSGYVLVLITNQSGIGRGLIRPDEFDAVQSRLIEMLDREGIPIAHTEYCPHHPDETCNCRKPKPGMIYAALEKLTLSPTICVMIGDKSSDVAAGQAANCYNILVKTGKSANNYTDTTADYVANDLLDAARHIVSSDISRYS